jgi:thiamine biosynthesis protein ThiS
VKLRVNGEWIEISQDSLSLKAVLDQLGHQQEYVAVALNQRCVRRAELASTNVFDTDEIEILTPRAGG